MWEGKRPTFVVISPRIAVIVPKGQAESLGVSSGQQTLSRDGGLNAAAKFFPSHTALK